MEQTVVDGTVVSSCMLPQVMSNTDCKLTTLPEMVFVFCGSIYGTVSKAVSALTLFPVFSGSTLSTSVRLHLSWSGGMKSNGLLPSYWQESGLYGDFTMLETMYYFGILHGMSRAKVKARGKFLLDLLDLPSHSKLIKKLRYVYDISGYFMVMPARGLSEIHEGIFDKPYSE